MEKCALAPDLPGSRYEAYAAALDALTSLFGARLPVCIGVLRKQLVRRISVHAESSSFAPPTKEIFMEERQAESEWVGKEGKTGLCRGTAPPAGAGHRWIQQRGAMVPQMSPHNPLHKLIKGHARDLSGIFKPDRPYLAAAFNGRTGTLKLNSKSHSL